MKNRSVSAFSKLLAIIISLQFLFNFPLSQRYSEVNAESAERSEISSSAETGEDSKTEAMSSESLKTEDASEPENNINAESKAKEPLPAENRENPSENLNPREKANSETKINGKSANPQNKKTDTNTVKKQSPEKPAENNLSFIIDYKDSGFLHAEGYLDGKKSRVKPALQFFRSDSSGETLISSSINEVFSCTSFINTGKYVSVKKWPLKNPQGEFYKYTVKPVFPNPETMYVENTDDTINAPDQYFSDKSEIDVSDSAEDSAKKFTLTASAELTFSLDWADPAAEFPDDFEKEISQLGFNSNIIDYYTQNKDSVKVRKTGDSGALREYAVDYLPKYDPDTPMLTAYEFKYGIDVATPSGYELVSTSAEKSAELLNFYPSGTKFNYIKLSDFVFTKVWADGKTDNTARPKPVFQLMQKNEGTGEEKEYPISFPEAEIDNQNPNIWKYTVKGLPYSDGTNALSYFVNEKNVPKGYTVSAYDFEKNQLVNSLAKNFEFSIVWNDNNDSKKRAPAGMDKPELILLRSGKAFQADLLVNPDDPDDPLIPDLHTLGKAGENNYRYDKLARMDEEGNEYKYRVFPAPSNFEKYNWYVQDSSSGSASWIPLTADMVSDPAFEGFGEKAKFRADLKANVRFTKKWFDASTFGSTRPQQQDWLSGVELYRQIRPADGSTEAKYEKIPTQLVFTEKKLKDGTLVGKQNDGSWYIEAHDLPAFSEKGDPYNYVFREAEVKSLNPGLGEYFTFPGKGKNIKNGSDSYSRIWQNINVNVHKYWIDGKKASERPDVAFYLFRFPINVHHPEKGENGFEIMAPVPKYEPVVLDTEAEKADSYLVPLMNGVPRYDAYGNAYVYYAYETMENRDYYTSVDNSGSDVLKIDGLKIKDVPKDKNGHDFFVLNNGSVFNTEFELIDVPFEKAFRAAVLQTMDGGINVQLQRKLKTQDDSKWTDVEGRVMQIEGFTAQLPVKEGMFKGLPQFDLGAFDLSGVDPSNPSAVRAYLDRYIKENLYEYRVREVSATINTNHSQKKPEEYAPVENNEFTDEGNTFEVNYSYDAETNFTRITNKIKGETELSFEKTWDPPLPAGLAGEVSVLLLRNDSPEWDASGIETAAPVRKSDQWTPKHPEYIVTLGGSEQAKFLKLPKYDDEGRIYTYKVLETGSSKPQYDDVLVNYEGSEDNESIIARLKNFKSDPGDNITPPGSGDTAIPPQDSPKRMHFLIEKKWRDDSDLLGRREVKFGMFYKEAGGNEWLPQTNPETGEAFEWKLNEKNKWILDILTPKLPGGRSFTVREINSDGFTVGKNPSAGEFLIDGDSAATQAYLESGKYKLGHTDLMKFDIESALTKRGDTLCFTVTNTRYALETISVEKEWYIDSILEDKAFIEAKLGKASGKTLKRENFFAHYELRDVNTEFLYSSFDLAAPAEGSSSKFSFGKVAAEINLDGSEDDMPDVNQFDAEGRYINYKVLETKIFYWDDVNGDRQKDAGDIYFELPFVKNDRAYLDPSDIGNSDYIENTKTNEKYTAPTTWQDKDKALLDYGWSNKIQGIQNLYLKKVWRDTGTPEQVNKRPDISLKIYRFTGEKPDPASEGHESSDESVALAVPQWNASFNRWYWDVRFSDLEKYDAQGKRYKYYAQERLVNNTNYRMSYFNQDEDQATAPVLPDKDGKSAKDVFEVQPTEGRDNFAYITDIKDESGIIINTPYDEEDFSGFKVWKLPDGSWFQKSDAYPSLTFKLYRLLDKYVKRIVKNPGTDQEVTLIRDMKENPLSINTEHVEEAFYLDEEGKAQPAEIEKSGKAGDYNYSFSRLPSLDAYGEKYYYFAREIEKDNSGNVSGASFHAYVIDTNDQTKTLTNVYKEDNYSKNPYVDVRVKKHWDWTAAGNKNGKYPDITFSLTRKTKKADGTEVHTENLAYVKIPGADIAGRNTEDFEIVFTHDGKIKLTSPGGGGGTSETVYTAENTEGNSDVKVFGETMLFYSYTDEPYEYVVSEAIGGYDSDAYKASAASISVSESDWKEDETDANLRKSELRFENTFNEGIQKEISGTKTWNDRDNIYGLRPANAAVAFESFTLKRNKNGQPDPDFSVKADLSKFTISGNDWSYKFTGEFPVYTTEGDYYKYYVEEVMKEPYKSAYTLSGENSLKLTNSLVYVNPSVIKEWYGSKSEKALSPNALEFLNKLGGIPDKLSFRVKYKKQGAADFSDFMEKKDGASAEEPVILSTSYKNIISSQYTFEKTLPKYYYEGDSAKEYIYRLDEEIPKEYKAVITKEDITDSGDAAGQTDKLTTHWKNTVKTRELYIVKNWEDESDRDGLRPSVLNVKINAENSQTSGSGGQANTFTLTVPMMEPEQLASEYKGSDERFKKAKERWRFSLEVPANDSFTYDAQELMAENSPYKAVAEKEVKAYVDKNKDIFFSFTNRHKVEKAKLQLTKKWQNDEKYAELSRPKSINTHLEYLKRKGNASSNKDWVDLSALSAEPSDIKGAPFGAAAKLSLKADEKGVWQGSFENLPLYMSRAVADGEGNTEYLTKSPAVYRIVEDEMPGYFALSEGAAAGASGKYEGIYSYNGESGSFTTSDTNTEELKGTITNILVTTKDIAGKKIWNDGDNQDGIRPKSVKIVLFAEKSGDDEKIKVEEKEVFAGDDENWSFSFKGLPAYDEKGEEITYTVEEAGLEGSKYESSIDYYELTNTHIPERINISVEKKWDDEEDRDGLRPGEIKVKLFADGKDTGSELVISRKTGWKASFASLPKFSQGKEIVYTLKEAEYEGYTVKITGNAAEGFVLINHHKPEKPGSEVPNGGKSTPSTGEKEGADGFVAVVILLAAGLLAGLLQKRRRTIEAEIETKR